MERILRRFECGTEGRGGEHRRTDEGKHAAAVQGTSGREQDSPDAKKNLRTRQREGKEEMVSQPQKGEKLKFKQRCRILDGRSRRSGEGWHGDRHSVVRNLSGLCRGPLTLYGSTWKVPLCWGRGHQRSCTGS